MSTRIRRIPWLAVTALLAFASRADAQLSASLGALVGYYRPYGSFEPGPVWATDLPARPSDMKGMSFGLSAAVSIASRVGIASTLATTRTDLPAVATPNGMSTPTNVHVLVGTLEGRVNVLPRSSATRLWLGAGPALVKHGGTAYSQFGGPKSYGGAASIEAIVPITRYLQWSAGATGVAYTIDLPMPPKLNLNPGKLQLGNQRDLLIRTGLAVRWH